MILSPAGLTGQRFLSRPQTNTKTQTNRPGNPSPMTRHDTTPHDNTNERLEKLTIPPINENGECQIKSNQMTTPTKQGTYIPGADHNEEDKGPGFSFRSRFLAPIAVV
jgi:hypothetical protein